MPGIRPQSRRLKLVRRILSAVNMTRRTATIIVVNILASLAGIIAVIIGAELYVRVKHSDYDLFNAGYEKPWFRKNPGDLTKAFTTDPDIGFCPIIPGQQYNEFGTLQNDYDIRTPQNDACRVLFVGDSVTRLGFIVEALRKIYGDQRYEYWNAGVDSFNTVQELNYYKKFNCRVNPDHVILTFHNNDFETTPIVFINKEGRMVLFSPFLPKNTVNEKLFRRSHVYRLALGKMIGARKEKARGQIVAEVKASLNEFDTILSRQGIRFTVLVHPVLNPKEKWTESEAQNHATVLRILKDAGIRHFDLSAPVWNAIRDGINPQWNRWKDDKAHPSREMADYFARFLAKNNLLETRANTTASGH